MSHKQKSVIENPTTAHRKPYLGRYNEGVIMSVVRARLVLQSLKLGF